MYTPGQLQSTVHSKKTTIMLERTRTASNWKRELRMRILETFLRDGFKLQSKSKCMNQNDWMSAVTANLLTMGKKKQPHKPTQNKQKITANTTIFYMLLYFWMVTFFYDSDFFLYSRHFHFILDLRVKCHINYCTQNRIN